MGFALLLDLDVSVFINREVLGFGIHGKVRLAEPIVVVLKLLENVPHLALSLASPRVSLIEIAFAQVLVGVHEAEIINNFARDLVHCLDIVDQHPH